MQIGQKIRKLRELRNFTQAYVADRMGISQPQYNRYEKGTSKISFHALEQIACILDTQVETILYFEEASVFKPATGITNKTRDDANEKELLQRYRRQIENLESELNTLKQKISQIPNHKN